MSDRLPVAVLLGTDVPELVSIDEADEGRIFLE